MSNYDINKLKETWREEQKLISKKTITEDQFNDIKLIGGLDISFVKNSDNACVTLAILTYPELEMVHQISEMVLLKYPYISDFLAFREVEHFMTILDKLDEKYKPDVILVDGNGLLHNRKCGCATHIGVLSGYPTIGVAKNLLYVEQFTREMVADEVKKIDQKKGNYFKLIGTSGFEYGACLLTTDTTKHPMYVSPGHKVSLDSALKIVTTCCNFKTPEPIRQADLISRDYIRKNQDKITISTENKTYIQPQQQTKNICFAIDISSSTAWSIRRPTSDYNFYGYNSRSEYNVKDERSMCIRSMTKDLIKTVSNQNLSFIGWSDQLKNITPTIIGDEKKYRQLSIGTTEPQLIVKPIYMSSDVLVFVTDGEIKTQDVEIMNTRVKEMKELPSAVVCIIVAPRKQTPEDEDISVFSALMTRPCVVLHNDGSSIVKLWDNIGLSDGSVPKMWTAAPKMDLTELMRIMMTFDDHNPNSLSIGNNLTIKIEDIAQMTKDQLLEILPHWRTVVFQQNIRDKDNGLKNLRRSVNSIFTPDEQLQKLNTQRMDLCSELKNNPKLRPKLNILNEQIRVAFLKNYKYTRAKSEMLATLHEYEKNNQDYSLRVLSSNRAMRANVVDTFPELDVLDESCPSKLQGDCSICYGEELDMWILLREGDKTLNTKDNVLTFPMSHDVFNQLCPTLLCYDCAIAMIGMGQDIYRQPVIGAIPMVNKFPTNSTPLYQALCSWLFGRSLHVSWHVFINSLTGIIMRDNTTLTQFIQPMNAIVSNLMTHDKLDGDNPKKIPLKTAVSHILEDSSAVMRQPLSSVSKLVSLANILELKTDEKEIDSLLQQRVVKFIIECYRNQITTEKVCELLFEKGPGMAYDVNLERKTPLKEFNLNLPDIYVDGKTININKLLPDNITRRLQEALLMTYKYGKQCKTDVLFRKVLTEDSAYKSINTKHADEKHLNPPPFITIWGPSLKKCSCGYTPQSTDQLLDHFKQVYNSVNPNKSSIHLNVHRLTQIYFSKNGVPTELRREDIVGILHEAYGRYGHGNKWSEHTLDSIVVAATSFINVWNLSDDQKEFKQVFSDIGSNTFMSTMSRENRLERENNLTFPTSDNRYDNVRLNTELNHPLTDEEYKKIKDSIPLPQIFK